MSHLLIKADARRIPLADRSVQCVVTSPPYFGLRDYQVAGQIGLEDTPEAFVAEMVIVFREVKRVLRDDGLLWLNMGDSFWSGKGAPKGEDYRLPNARRFGARPQDRTVLGMKRKDLLMMPARLALALQADGWYIRQECVWAKRNGMVESVRDRPVRAHEMVYLLSKAPRYYYDDVATRTPQKTAGKRHEGLSGYRAGHPSKGGIKVRSLNPLGAAERSVWSISTTPFKSAHFATMPIALADKCIRLGTSEKGCCPRCRTPWRRIVDRKRSATRPDLASKYAGIEQERCNHDRGRHVTSVEMIGWESSCTCLEPVPVPCIVLDPFSGAATTGVAAEALGRHFIGTDLSDEYLAMSAERLSRPHAPAKEPRASKPGRPTPLFAKAAR